MVGRTVERFFTATADQAGVEHLLRNAVDLVIKNGPVTAFMRMAKRDGIPL
jgi:hypothetical protein